MDGMEVYLEHAQDTRRLRNFSKNKIFEGFQLKMFCISLSYVNYYLDEH